MSFDDNECEFATGGKVESELQVPLLSDLSTRFFSLALSHLFLSLEYNGDASQAPFTLDYGSIGAGPEGVLLELTAARQAKVSTTRYFLYGEVEVEARHEAVNGVVAALITMSDAKDGESRVIDSPPPLLPFCFSGQNLIFSHS